MSAHNADSKKAANPLKVAMITCWYKDISMANYATNLQRGATVDWQVVSSHCGCCKRYSSKDFLQGDCKFISFPPYVRAVEDPHGPRGLHFLLSVSGLFLQSLRGVAYLSKCKQCDVIHYQQSVSQSFGLSSLNMLLMIPIRKKRVVTVHSLDRLSNLKFFSRSYKNADMILVHSNEMKQRILALGIPEERIRVVHHGATLPALLGIPRKEITFFGSPIKGKGFWTILQALKILKKQNRQIRLNIYGIYSEAEKNEAVDAATEFDVADLLTWGKRLSDPEFDQKMQESLFTLAVYNHVVSGSSVVTRAMSNATPVIASNIGGIPEYLGDAGLLVPPDNPQALALAMVKMLDDATLREKFSAVSRKRAEDLSWDKVADLTTGIYYECLHKTS